MKKETLKNFLNDRYTDKELDEILQWLEKNPFDPQKREQSFEEWKKLNSDEELSDEKTLDELLHKIHHEINTRQPVPTGSKQTELPLTWLTRVAAILLLPVTLFLLYTLTEQTDVEPEVVQLAVDSLEIVAPVGSQTVVQLSDGSEVHLNHGSRLKYPYTFSGNSRDVVLTGEGYFNVAHNPEMPFVVHTPNLNVRAVGTSFNVFAYANEPLVSTTLVEGKVLVERINKNNETKKLGAMVPGQHVEYHAETGNVNSTKGDIEKYISWKDGKLIFKNESIVQITNRLSRWYNVDFRFADEAAKSYTYTATFVDEPLYQILDLLEIATPVRYKALPREKLPDGTWSKQEIIIETRKTNK